MIKKCISKIRKVESLKDCSLTSVFCTALNSLCSADREVILQCSYTVIELLKYSANLIVSVQSHSMNSWFVVILENEFGKAEI